MSAKAFIETVAVHNMESAPNNRLSIPPRVPHYARAPHSIWVSLGDESMHTRTNTERHRGLESRIELALGAQLAFAEGTNRMGTTYLSVGPRPSLAVESRERRQSRSPRSLTDADRSPTPETIPLGVTANWT